MSKIYLGQHDPESYSRKEREDIERATWLLKCRSITIDNGDGRRYSGPGFIRQESSELISWALFDTEASVHLGHALEALGTPGEWLPDTLFYTLAAEDWTGRVWTASDVRITLEGGPFQLGAAISGTLTELTCLGNYRPNRSYIRISYAQPLRLPINDHRDVLAIAPDQYMTDLQHSLTSLSDGTSEVQIVSWPNVTRVSYHAPPGEPLPADLPERLEESLWLLTGQPAHWRLMEAGCVSRGKRLSVRTTGNVPPSRWFRGPLDPKLPPTWEHWEQFFFRYLGYLQSQPEGSRSPMSVDVWRIYQASTRAIEDLALTLAVAVERVVTKHYARYCTPPPEEMDGIDALTRHLAGWTGPDTLKKRALRAFSHWKGPNARAGMHNLVGAGLIGEQHRQVWEKLRHTYAHGGNKKGPKKHLLKEILLLHQLWLLLVARHIGYGGKLTDWTTAGWPLRTLDELAAGAER